MDTLPPSPLLSSPRLCYLAHATLRHAVPCRAMPRRGAPLTKETCSLPAAARALASRRRDALLTILGQDSLSLPFSFSLSPSLSFFLLFSLSLSISLSRRHASTSGTLEWLVFYEPGILRSLGGKGQPPLSVPPCLMRSIPSCRQPPREVTSRRSAKGNYRGKGSTSWKCQRRDHSSRGPADSPILLRFSIPFLGNVVSFHLLNPFTYRFNNISSRSSDSYASREFRSDVREKPRDFKNSSLAKR